MQSMALISGRVWSPKGSRPRFCRHQMPKANLSSFVGAKVDEGIEVPYEEVNTVWLQIGRYAASDLMSGGYQSGLGLLKGLENRLHKGRKVVGLSAGNNVTVADDLGVHIFASGVDHIVLDGEEASSLTALERLSRAQDPRPVTDGRDHFALLGHGADQANHWLAAAQVIRRIAAGNDHHIKIIRRHILGGLVAFDWITELARVCLTRFGS